MRNSHPCSAIIPLCQKTKGSVKTSLEALFCFVAARRGNVSDVEFGRKRKKEKKRKKYEVRYDGVMVGSCGYIGGEDMENQCMNRQSAGSVCGDGGIVLTP